MNNTEYKQTEVGLIPSDWEVKPLSEIVNSFQLGGNYTNNEIEGNNVLVKMANLGRGNIELNKRYFISPEIIPSENDRVFYGDVLFNTRNTLDLVGKVAIWRDELPKAYFNSNIMRIIFKEEEISSNFFMNLIFNTRISIYQLRGIATGTTSVAAIYTRDLIKLLVPIATKAEQTAIATALSDADALISSLEKLIAKKRNIKQGAMQKLLQPKEGWEVKKLGSIGKPYGGLSGKSKLDFADGKFPYIPFMNIMSSPIIDTSYVDYVNIGVVESQNKALKGDLFFNGSSETPEEVGMCSVLLEDIPNLYLNSFCFGFRLNKDSKENGLYLSYYFRSSEGRKLFYSMAQGATRYNLSKSNFNKMEVSLPKPEEQIEIENILTDMNNEINALETKLEKYKKVKLGMMQNLLTGKIRLV